MMKNYGFVEDGKVSRVDFLSEAPTSEWVEMRGGAGVGWTVVDGGFVAPENTPQLEVSTPTERYISGVDFLRRFSPEQRIAARQLAKTDPVVEDFFDLLDKTIAQSGQVNLLDQDTVLGVNYLSQALPDAQINPSVILA